MAQQKICSVIKPFMLIQIHHRLFGTTTALSLQQKWRKERGLPLNPNACGVLTDAPDYTFLDGKLTPYGMRQRQRLLNQRQIVHDIIKLTNEVDFAVERHEQLQMKEENRRKEIIGRKLKPKGFALLKSK